MKKVTNQEFTVDITSRRLGDPAALISNNSKLTVENADKFNWNPKYNNLELICKSAYEWEKSLIN